MSAPDFTIPESDGLQVKKLGEGLWAIEEGMVRCYLVAGSERAVIIDCCMEVSNAVADVAHGLTDKPITLVLTHGDPDHTGGQDGFDAPMLHPSEFGHYYSRGNTGHAIRPLWEGDVFDLGGRSLEVVLIPGHTPGSVAYLDRAHKRIFVGDSVSDYWIFLFGPGRDAQALIESLKKLQGRADSFETVHPCHGSAELGNEWIGKTITATEKLLAGELVGAQPPRSEMPCKAYSYEGVTLMY